MCHNFSFAIQPTKHPTIKRRRKNETKPHEKQKTEFDNHKKPCPEEKKTF